MSGLLLDTHALYWLVSGEEPLAEEALIAIGENQEARTLLASPITAWELAVAARKQRAIGRPNLGDQQPDRWFRSALSVAEARVVPIRQHIAIEAAKVVTETRHKDPGDCFLIATARARKVPLVTRDAIIRSIAADIPAYLDVIVC